MLTSALVELPDYATLVERSGGHPFARWHHSPADFERAWAFGDATGWTVTGRYGPVLVALGAGADAGRLVTLALSGLPSVARVVMTAAALPHVEAPLGDGDDWDWFWTTSAPPPRPGEAAVAALGLSDHEELAALLHASSPRTSAQADDPTVRTWLGLRDPSGALVACAAEHEQAPGVRHLRAIATHPSHRGRGYGADVTAAATRAGLASAGAHAVTLGMYADNHVARRLYERLGFTVGQAFATRAVAR
ncbi:GNAT family N-acetyltransferase [Jiangella anatolica]|uniref:N-acetyltransferase domain-containing protein n=1 Tax=Jiangella anatolica TaxID=2670374 RepID=A0A2W2BJL3_9ACTN|nr:GNAT family N-acetyltransferase [Jiangella anatolica]PZF85450.1 hypothetical protein C1I92_04885 [Jiangella anatolica]